MRGYVGQYGKAGAAIYAELTRGHLEWIGIADRTAGIADDLVLGFDGLVIGHQFKTAQFPGTFTVSTLLMGAEGLLKPLVHAWQSLRQANPGANVQIRLVTSDYPSLNDTPGDGAPGHTAAFLEEFDRLPERTLTDWGSSAWSGLIAKLLAASGLADGEFERFLHSLRVLHGAAADFVQLHKLSADEARLAAEIADALPKLVTHPSGKERWTREELLRELAWKDPAKTRHLHRFPIGAYVQRNRDSEQALLAALRTAASGYISLVGPPGSGKSTLLQMALATEPKVRLVRYLAFVPGAAQNVGRGEADDFLEDIAAQLRNGGLHGLRLRDSGQHERREQFGTMLRQAGERYEKDGVRTIIVVDGLDHIPREERPVTSLLGELPLPAAVPAGVVFVLGTQRLDLAQLKPAVQEQAAEAGRLVSMSPLSRDAVAQMADALGLDGAIPRLRLSEIGQGHPLATRYLIQALLRADDTVRTHLLEGGMPFDGDIETVYAAAWREIVANADALRVLGYIARSEAPMPLELLATVVAEAAIEQALVTARHLLSESPQGWSVFHNSFRLFVLAKPVMRLGRVDDTHSERVYRELAQLARSAPTTSAQRWLELRYLARASDNGAVLALATPQRFREELANGRGVADIQADIRLAVYAVRGLQDATALTRLLLCRDELSRRTSALDGADRLPIAMLAVGQIDAAYTFAKDFPNMGYEVVDKLLALGDFERAKNLFETLEPVAQLHTSRYENYGEQHNLKEFEKWATRSFHFRDFEQIQQAIDFLVAEGLKHASEKLTEEEREAATNHLRMQVAEAAIASRGSTAPTDLCRLLGVPTSELSALLAGAAIAARDAGDAPKAHSLFMDAAALPGFEELHNGWRRAAALTAMSAGSRELAESIFEGLAAPNIAMGDSDTDLSGPSDLAQAVLEHAQLCTLLARPLPDAVLSSHSVLQPLHAHATTIGVLLAQSQMGSRPVPLGSVRMATRAAMGYVLRLSPNGGGDHYRVMQAVRAAPVFARALLKVAAACGEDEYRATLREIDQAIPTATVSDTSFLRRETAVAAYLIDGDHPQAAQRLEALATDLQEQTPREQLDGLADLTIAFAAVEKPIAQSDFLLLGRTTASVTHCLPRKTLCTPSGRMSSSKPTLPTQQAAHGVSAN
jgi:hypothetical protein